MFDKFFEKYPDYRTIQKPTGDILIKFNSKLPVQLIDLPGQEMRYGQFTSKTDMIPLSKAEMIWNGFLIWI